MTEPRSAPSLVRLLSVVVLVVLSWTPAAESAGSCASVGRCCQGKDNQCHSQTEGNSLQSTGSENAEDPDARTTKACFCDAACTDIGDCCPDYRQQCPPVDCVVADGWQPWSNCSTRCGLGSRHRTRRVVRWPMNGGRPCEPTVQKSICFGSNCKQTRAHGHVEMRETATLLPATLGEWRKSKRYNPYLDIRKNIYENQIDLQNSLNRPSYCAVYEVTDVRPSCSTRPKGLATDVAASWTSNLTKGAHVCAECQPTAMQTKLGGRCKGAGLLRKETQWMAMGVPGCHGAWVMKTRQSECRCDGDRVFNVILV